MAIFRIGICQYLSRFFRKKYKILSDKDLTQMMYQIGSTIQPPEESKEDKRVCLFCHLFLFSFIFPKTLTIEHVPIGLQSLLDNIFNSCATQSLQNDTRTGAPFDSNKTVEKLFTSFLRETMALKSDVKDPLVMYIIMGTISL